MSVSSNCTNPKDMAFKPRSEICYVYRAVISTLTDSGVHRLLSLLNTQRPVINPYCVSFFTLAKR